ncbi:hypothetical protein E2C01_073380 [Portunus trituberculatus]|uniref:Uncharacterized protein n=1 Tax=Portunus trituberculatus TaxID=210409 RepID=A0A5B7IDE3_PORTR|nr:hypothetical protein [Portunus trituberculatus]
MPPPGARGPRCEATQPGLHASRCDASFAAGDAGTTTRQHHRHQTPSTTTNDNSNIRCKYQKTGTAPAPATAPPAPSTSTRHHKNTMPTCHHDLWACRVTGRQDDRTAGWQDWHQCPFKSKCDAEGRQDSPPHHHHINTTHATLRHSKEAKFR